MFQNAPFDWKNLTTRYRKKTIIVTIKQRIVRIKGDKNRAVNFDFRWQRAPHVKLLSPGQALLKQPRLKV